MILRATGASELVGRAGRCRISRVPSRALRRRGPGAVAAWCAGDPLRGWQQGAAGGGRVRAPSTGSAECSVEHQWWGDVVVDVAGAVRSRGSTGCRRARGSTMLSSGRVGPRRGAVLEAINLAARLADGQQVVVPKRAPAVPPRPGRRRERPDQPRHGDGRAARHDRRHRPGDGAEDRRVPRPARRARLGRPARPGQRHRAGDDGVAAGSPAALSRWARAPVAAAPARGRRRSSSRSPTPTRSAPAPRRRWAAACPPARRQLARGFVLGEDDGIDARTDEDFRRAGLSHLLAVSGQNVALLALLAMPVLGALGDAAARAPGLGPRPDRRLRAAGRRRALDPARRRDGRAERARDPRRPPPSRLYALAVAAT